MHNLQKHVLILLVPIFCILFVSSKKLSGFVVSLYQVVRLLPILNYNTLAFSKSLPMLKKCFDKKKFDTESYKKQQTDFDAHYLCRSWKT